MKTPFFMIEIILIVFSIPLYIINRGKFKEKMKKKKIMYNGIEKTLRIISIMKNGVFTTPYWLYCSLNKSLFKTPIFNLKTMKILKCIGTLS